MADVSPKAPEQRLANLAALHQSLNEMAGRIKRSDQAAGDRSREVQEPVLVIRGK